jgi:hypothetical protein
MDQTRETGYSPTIRKRALARKLTEHRQRLGLTTTDVQRRLGWSATKLNWIEKARWTESVTDSVTDLCELYGIEGPERDALITLARQSRERGWWTKYNDVFGKEELPGWEAGASAIWTFEDAFIPGLLQTRDYIELITRAAGITDPAEIRRHTEARTRRQHILTREPGPTRTPWPASPTPPSAATRPPAYSRSPTSRTSPCRSSRSPPASTRSPASPSSTSPSPAANATSSTSRPPSTTACSRNMTR